MLKRIALQIPPIKRLWDDRLNLLAERDKLRSELHDSNRRNSRFYHYASSFDAIEVIMRHARHDISPTHDKLTNFLGVKITPSLFDGLLDGSEGTVEGAPIPSNWHSDIAEWAPALRAVDRAKGTFRAIELGCGWGCWLLNTGVAARHAGLNVDLVGVEGDRDHVKFAHQSMADNDFSESDYQIIHGIAAGKKGKALFPVVEKAGATWGSEPIFNATPDQILEASQKGSHDILEMYPISEISDGKIVDLLHLDIQGGEVDFVSSCLDDMNKYVRSMVVGTHSRIIDGEIMKIMLSAGWELEIERPSIIGIERGGPLISVDGAQGWRNPRL